MSHRLLCVWLPNWPIQRVGAEEPQLADAPLILSARDARRGLVVAAANLAARAAGVQPAARLSEATALVDAEVREHEPHEDIETLCHLAEEAQQFSPLVGIEQLEKKRWAGRTLHQPECLLLDITGVANLFGGEAPLLHEVSQWLAQKRYFACLGLAGSIGTAWAIANYANRRPPDTATHTATTPAATADRATPELDAATPNPELPLPPVPACRQNIVPPGMDIHALADLPTAALRLPPETVTSLRRLGIYTIGSLDQLPRDGMATRLGELFIARWDQARGLKNEAITHLHSQPDWSLDFDLEFPTSDRDTIVELVRRICTQLSQRLKRRGEGALRIVCRLDLVEAPPLVMQLGMYRPTNDADHLELLLCGQLDQCLRNLGASLLWRLNLQATMTAKMAWRQTDLFDDGEADNRNQLARLIDSLSSRLGRKQVLSASVSRESQPELAYVLQPLTGRTREGNEQPTVKKISSRLARRRVEPAREAPLRRPTHLFERPVPIEVRAKPSNTGLASSIDGGRFAAVPAQFKYQNVWHQVLDARGPERLESGWWRGPSARRDYFRVVAAPLRNSPLQTPPPSTTTPLPQELTQESAAISSGSWWWIYRDMNTGQWHLHGLFD